MAFHRLREGSHLRETSKHGRSRVRRAHARSVLSGFPGQSLPPGLLSQSIPLTRRATTRKVKSSCPPCCPIKHILHISDCTQNILHFITPVTAKQHRPRLRRSICEIALTWKHPGAQQDRERPKQTAVRRLFRLLYSLSCRSMQRPVCVLDHPSRQSGCIPLCFQLAWSQPRTAAIKGTLHGAGCSWSRESGRPAGSPQLS